MSFVASLRPVLWLWVSLRFSKEPGAQAPVRPAWLGNRVLPGPACAPQVCSPLGSSPSCQPCVLLLEA